jgi:hypothetical protein
MHWTLTHACTFRARPPVIILTTFEISMTHDNMGTNKLV